MTPAPTTTPTPRRLPRRARSVGATVLAVCVLAAGLLGLPGATAPARAAEAAAFDAATFDPARLSAEPMTARWGVTGRARNIHDGTYGKGPQPFVWDITTIGDLVYIAGIFTSVRRNEYFWPADPPRNQPFLAAFDRVTGEFVPSFAPQLDGPVYDVVGLPDGSLLAGGEFSTVNGKHRTALVALDPNTGATLERFATTLTAPGSPQPAYVKELLVDGGRVYVGGGFSHVLDGADNFVWNAVRLDVATGRLDRSWVPRAAGSVYDLAIDHGRGRVHLAGYFSSVDALPNTDRLASIDIVTGRAIPGLAQYVSNSSGNDDVVGLVYANDAVWGFGGNHLVGVVDATTNSLITSFQGSAFGSSTGDLQVAELYGRYALAGHHRDGNGAVHVFDTVTRTVDNRWTPNLLHGWYGVWALHLDRDGCLWVGGDMTRTTTGNWMSGFARLCGPNPERPAPTPAENYALHANATQSSSARGAEAAKAVDGDIAGLLAEGSVSLTGNQSEPWWQVDLGEVRDIGVVQLFGRTDCCPEQGSNLWILGSTEPITAAGLAAAKATPGVIAAPLLAAGRPSDVALNRNIRYLRVQREGTGVLALAEVRALARRSDEATPPSGLRALPGPDNVVLRWSAPADESVAGYVIHRDGLFRAWAPNITFFQDFTARAGETHRYEIRTRTTDGRLSAPASLGIGGADTTAPTPPSRLVGTAGAAGVALDWSAATDDVGVRGYLVHRDYAFLAWVPAGTTFVDSTATPGVRYRYEVRAQDAAGNTGPPSNPVVLLAGAGDSAAPTVPTGVTANPTPAAVELSWQPSVDNGSVAGYLIHRNYTFLAWVPAGKTTFTDATAASGFRYRYEIRAIDDADNLSGPSSAVNVLAGTADTTAPSAPGQPTATVSTTAVTLQWAAASDDVGVAGYLVHRNGQFVAWVPSGTRFTDSGLVAGSTHRYEVRAQDPTGNNSAPSAPLTVTLAAA